VGEGGTDRLPHAKSPGAAEQDEDVDVRRKDCDMVSPETEGVMGPIELEVESIEPDDNWDRRSAVRRALGRRGTNPDIGSGSDMLKPLGPPGIVNSSGLSVLRRPIARMAWVNPSSSLSLAHRP
jgi:hypothetical protein